METVTQTNHYLDYSSLQHFGQIEGLVFCLFFFFYYSVDIEPT